MTSIGNRPSAVAVRFGSDANSEKPKGLYFSSPEELKTFIDTVNKKEPKTVRGEALGKLAAHNVAAEATAVVLAVMLFKPIEKGAEKVYAALFKNKLVGRMTKSVKSGFQTVTDKTTETFQLKVAAPIRKVYASPVKAK